MLFGTGGGVNLGGARYSSVNTGRTSGGFGGNTVAYPNPFFDVAHTYLPQTVRQMFRWCRYYYLTNPVVAAAIYRMSEYPVTDIWVQHPDEATRQKWTDLAQRKWHIRSFQIGVNLDYNTYGNALVSIFYPFVKYLTCGTCGKSVQARKFRHRWKMVECRFRLHCPSCGKEGVAAGRDIYVRNASQIRLLRHNPENIETTYNELTNTQVYYYNLPNSVRNGIMAGRQEFIEEIPQLYLQAVAEKKMVVFNQSQIFHIKRPSLADSDRGWGSPLMLPLLKDLFGIQILKKANETILLEHILPLRVLFPQAASGTADPFLSTDLTGWKEKVASEIARWKMDRNYYPILPLPIGNQTIGGDGRAMLMSQEVVAANGAVLEGMGIPKELVTGGLSWSGANISLRMLENTLLRTMERHDDMFAWIVNEVSAFMGWPRVQITAKPFKMADDLQRKSLDFQLQQSGLLSATTLLDSMDYDFKKESEIMAKETSVWVRGQKAKRIAQAELEGEVMVINSKYQAQAQAAMAPPPQGQPAPGEQPAPASPPPPDQGGVPGGQEAVQQPPAEQGQQPPPGTPMEQAMQSPLTVSTQGGGVPIHRLAELIAKSIMQLPPPDQEARLSQLAQQQPDLAELVRRALSMLAPPPPMESAVDMRPMPEVLPPRRVG